MKRFMTFFAAIILCFSLSACGGKDTINMYGTDLGELTHDSVDVMGVTYQLYSNGYGLIERILHENAQIGESVSYDGKEYSVLSFVQPKTKETGAFGLGECHSPKNSILPDSILGITNYALAYCDAETITLPANLQSLGAGTFRECRNIETIELPDSLTYIGASKLFQNCTSLKTVVFPSNCRIQFFDNTFEGCTSLETVTIPSSVDYIGELAFYQCTSLTSVTIEDGVKAIQAGAFTDCPALTSLVIPDSVTEIENYAFQGCTGLTDIVLPDNMTDVSAKLFSDINQQSADVSGLTIHAKADLVSYVQSIYPAATVVTK